jgi:hypothetical protein
VSDDAEIAWRIDALRARLTLDGSRGSELTILGLDPEPGRCPSCGDRQPYGQTGKCTRCCLASATVLRNPTFGAPSVDDEVRELLSMAKTPR